MRWDEVTPCKWLYLESSFQNTLSANPKIDGTMPMPSLEIMFWQKALHKYVHISAHTHIWKALYQITTLELGFGIARSFSGMAINAFWKRQLHFLTPRVNSTRSDGVAEWAQRLHNVYTRPDRVAEWAERLSPNLGGWGSRTLRVQTLVESNRWLLNWYLSLHSQLLGIIRIW